MRREISSQMTAVNKLASLLIFGVGMPFFLFANFPFGNFHAGDLFNFLFWSAVSIAIVYWSWHFKQVDLADHGLFIYQVNFGHRKEIFVPFRDIENVSQKFWQRSSMETVTIEFVAPSEFGKKIKFYPKSRFLPLLEHPIVSELNKLIILHK